MYRLRVGYRDLLPTRALQPQTDGRCGTAVEEETERKAGAIEYGESAAQRDSPVRQFRSPGRAWGWYRKNAVLRRRRIQCFRQGDETALPRVVGQEHPADLQVDPGVQANRFFS